MTFDSDYHANSLIEALDRLSGTIPDTAVEYLKRHAPGINKALNDKAVTEIGAFSQSGNPNILPGLARHAGRHTDEILRLLSGGQVQEFEFVREHARELATEYFPLEAALHAYRCNHKVFSSWLRKAALESAPARENARKIIADVADFILEYTDTVSTVAASAYVSQTQLIANASGDQRNELFNILLDGFDESDGRVAKILRDAGYLDRRQSFCVAVAQSVNPTEMLNPTRARRMVDSIDETLRRSSVRRLIDLRHNQVTIIFSANRRASGWTAPHKALAEKLKTDLLKVGNAVFMGVSNDVPSTSQIPGAYKEAQLALELAGATRRVVQFSEISMRRLMLHLAGSELRRVLPVWSGEFFLVDDKSGGVLSATLRAYANANMNVLKAAEILSVHPNTIYSRLQKIADITGLEARSFHELSELLIIADCGSRREQFDHAGQTWRPG